MNERQLEAINIAQVLNDMSASTHNKARTILNDLAHYPPENQPTAMAKVKALLTAVDGWQQTANAWLTAVINDREYPA